jgi:hypothetical protein
MDDSAFNPSRRRLCPDGACVGLIGDDGRCRECGRPASGGSAGPAPSAADLALEEGLGSDSNGVGAHARARSYDDDDQGAPDDGSGGGAPAGTDDDEGRPSLEAGSAGERGFRPDRRLCDDGDCLGVVGADGVCPLCGRRSPG